MLKLLWVLIVYGPPKWRDWNSGSLWLTLINIYDYRRKLNKANSVILNSLQSWLAGLTTKSGARSEGVVGTTPLRFSLVLWSTFPAAWDLPRWYLSMTGTAALTFMACFLCLCDVVSEGMFASFKRGGLCPKILALQPCVIALLSVSRLCIYHSLNLCMVWWPEFFHLGAECWRGSISACVGESRGWFNFCMLMTVYWMDG